ncbi:hypothetical protein Pelo_18590 [Pelomyxa schiedti]|nr:hypothetical protein Pelo_18590 [Pelomyxa schiedti]
MSAATSRKEPSGDRMPLAECVLVGDSGCISSLFDDLVARGISPRPAADPHPEHLTVTVTLPSEQGLVLERTHRHGHGHGHRERGRGVRVRLSRTGWGDLSREMQAGDGGEQGGSLVEGIRGRGGVDAVVVVVMANSSGGCYEIPVDMVFDLGALYTGSVATELEVIAATAADAKNLLLVDCGIGITREKKARDAKFMLAFEGSPKKGDNHAHQKNCFNQYLKSPGSPVMVYCQIIGLASSPSVKESFMPPGTALEITHMCPATVRNKFLPTCSHLSPDTQISVAGAALKRWIQVKNWPAVTELILAKATQYEDVTLEYLNLKSVPELLSGITCNKLDLHHNPITRIPQWLAHAKIQDVILFDKAKEEPMKGRDMHHMLFGESPMCPNSHKLICFGEGSGLREDILQCLKDKRHKLKLFKIKYNQSAVIDIKQQFKMHSKEESHTWTVWSLSMQCWSQSYHHGNAQIVLLVHSGVDGDIQKKIAQIVDPILHSDRFKNLTLRGIAVINNFQEYEWFSDTTPFPFNATATSTPITGKQVGKISQLLERIATETTRAVSPRWIALSERLRVMRESIIKWTDLVRIAASCGVGVPALCRENPEASPLVKFPTPPPAVCCSKA